MSDPRKKYAKEAKRREVGATSEPQRRGAGATGQQAAPRATSEDPRHTPGVAEGDREMIKRALGERPSLEP